MVQGAGGSQGISIHALREEGDQSCRPKHSNHFNFYPRPPRGGRLRIALCRASLMLFLSTPSARRATPACRHRPNPGKNFYPRPPRGGRPSPLHLHFIFLLFLSTPSARRATMVLWPSMKKRFDFYPRPPRGGRPGDLHPVPYWQDISIHALREEGDDVEADSFGEAYRFLSTPSARRATIYPVVVDFVLIISIHALREEGDLSLKISWILLLNFYPRPPRGGRRAAGAPNTSRRRFLSTPSGRRATYRHDRRRLAELISIHALREEGD